jgi:exodeoxyribonuclease-1
MDASFFFYDLETSGFNPRQARIMQFAGQRTDLNLKPIDDPVNKLIKLTPDVVPDVDAVLLTGITPQATLDGGLNRTRFSIAIRRVCQPAKYYIYWL